MTEVENGEKQQHFCYDWFAMLLDSHALIRLDVLVQEIGIISLFCQGLELGEIVPSHA